MINYHIMLSNKSMKCLDICNRIIPCHSPYKDILGFPAFSPCYSLAFMTKTITFFIRI